MHHRSLNHASPALRTRLANAALVVALSSVTVLLPCVVRAADPTTGSTAFTLTARADTDTFGTTGDNQGFSVESADFAHGYLSTALLAQWLKTLGPHGVI